MKSDNKQGGKRTKAGSQENSKETALKIYQKVTERWTKRNSHRQAGSHKRHEEKENAQKHKKLGRYTAAHTSNLPLCDILVTVTI